MASEGKLALVTGASSGIGEGFARRLAKDGYRVIVCARRKERLDTLAAELKEEYSAEVFVAPSDLSTSGGVLALWTQLEAMDLPAPDLLVNNAGFGTLCHFNEEERDVALEMVGLNVAAVVDLTHRALGPMVERGSGAIINVASVAAFQPVPYYAVYCATKGFVLQFTETLALELKGSGVKLQCLCPGGTRTEFPDVAGVSSEAAEFGMMDVDPVVDASLRALKAGRLVCVPGAMNKFSVGGAKVLPRSLTGTIAGRVMEKVRK